MRTLHPLPAPDEPAPGLGKWIDAAPAKKKPAKKRSVTARDSKGYQRAREEAAMRAKANDWVDAEPRHLVGLYVVLHEQIYSVPPTELVDVWKGAVAAAKAMLRKEFSDDTCAFVEFILWTWRRARKRRDKATRDSGDVMRVGWTMQFKNRLYLTDYRVEMASAQEAMLRKGKR